MPSLVVIGPHTKEKQRGHNVVPKGIYGSKKAPA